MNRAAFYRHLRRTDSGLFGTSLSQGQVDGVEAILDATNGLPLAQRAYILATAYHETGKTMQPIREANGKSDVQTIRRLDKAWADGKLSWVKRPYWRKDKNGKAWYGRGLVQLTHRDNYAKAGRKLKIDLLSDPNLALRMDVSVKILMRGMLEGWFTGKALGDYVNEAQADFVGARRVVNGIDRAALIAGYAASFQQALEAGTARVVDEPEPERTPGLLDAILEFLALLFLDGFLSLVNRATRTGNRKK